MYSLQAMRTGHPCSDGDLDCESGGIVASSPQILSGLPVYFPELRGHFVSVVAIDEDGDIAHFSNRCGMAARWCLAAPGDDITILYWGRNRSDITLINPINPCPPSDPASVGSLLCPVRGQAEEDGTSFAAPFVTGSLAVLAHWFRDQLRNTELLERLYETADVTPDTVAPGNECPEYLDTDGDRSDCELSSTHGQGVIDLSAATAPRGDLRLSGALAVSSRLRMGAAFGDAPAEFTAREVALFDDLNAPFWVPLGAFVGSPGAQRLDYRMYRSLAGLQAARSVFSPVAGIAGRSSGPWINRLYDRADSHASLAAGGIQAGLTSGAGSLFAFTAPGGQAWGLGAALQPGPLYLGAGWLREEQGLLGSSAHGGFGTLAADTAFAGAGAAFQLGAWDIAVSAELGASAPKSSGILEFSSLWTSTYALHAQHRRLRLSLTQPLRAESGTADLQLPVGRTKAGEPLYAHAQYPLQPSGRQLDFSVSWDQPLAVGGLRLEAVYTRDPGHVRGHSDTALLASYRMQF